MDAHHAVPTHTNRFAPLLTPNKTKGEKKRRVRRRHRRGPDGEQEVAIVAQKRKSRLAEAKMTCKMLGLYIKHTKDKVVGKVEFRRRWVAGKLSYIFNGVKAIVSQAKAVLPKAPKFPQSQASFRLLKLENQMNEALQRIEELERMNSRVQNLPSSDHHSVSKQAAAPVESKKAVGWPEAPKPTIDPARPAVSISSSDPALQKYIRMMKVGVPQDAVVVEMKKDGRDPHLLFPEAALADDATTVKKRNEWKAKEKSKPKAALLRETPQKSEKPLSKAVITMKDLEGVKLRPTPQKVSHRRLGNSPGAIVSLDQLRNTNLNHVGSPQTRQTTPSRLRPVAIHPILGDIGNVKLRKTMGDRSPGGTPMANRGKRTHAVMEDRSPSTAKTDAEYLELALRRKFHRMNPSFPSPGAVSTGSNEAWSATKPTRQF